MARLEHGLLYLWLEHASLVPRLTNHQSLVPRPHVPIYRLMSDVGSSRVSSTS